MFVFCYYEYLEYLRGDVTVHKVHTRCLRRLPPPQRGGLTMSDQIRGWTRTFDGSACKVCGQQILRRYNTRGPGKL